MNPFSNNSPNLSSGDRTRDKRDKYIYAAAKKNFQSNRQCNNKNIRYYRNGSVRSNVNYKYKNALSRGNVLCEDCNGRGILCGKINKSAGATIRMSNNEFSEFYGGGALSDQINSVELSLAFPVIKSDISGVWGTSTTDINKEDLSGGTLCGPSNNILCPFGYADNLIKIPRNLNGDRIIIDPANILFPTSSCGIFSYYKKHTFLRKGMVIRGGLNLDGDPLGPFVFNPSCNDPSYNNLVGNFVQLGDVVSTSPTFNFKGILFGKISKICCLRETIGVPWFDIFIDVYHIQQYDFLNIIVNTNPIFQPGQNNTQLVSKHYCWDSLSFFPFGFLIYSKETAGAGALVSINYDGYIESVRLYQGSCEDNQTNGNKTQQSYMSCLEDGTKKIKFT